MFSKAKATKPAHEERAKASAHSEAPTASAAPVAPSKRSSAMKSAGVPSIISADVVMRGHVNASGEVQLDGELEGDIKAAALMVGEKATVRGDITCDAVTIRGRVEGGIRAKQVTLAATAHIEGDIVHSSLSVEAGAHFDGNVRHSDDPLSEASATDFRKARPGAPAPSPAPAPAPRPTANNDDTGAARLPNGGDAPSFLSQNRSPLR